MKRIQFSAAAMVLAVATAAVAWSQVPPAPPSEKSQEGRMTDQQKQEMLRHWKTKPEQTWSDFIEEWLTPKPFSKKYVVRIDDKYAYPHVASSIKMEIVREDDDNVWLRGIPPENPGSPLYRVWSQMQAEEARLVQQMEAMEDPGAVYFLDFEAEVVPPPFQDGLRFEPRLKDLPSGGRWQMGFAEGDVNEDGRLDLVFPPERKGYKGRPSVFLGRENGAFEPWDELVWPSKLPLDYGGVEVADLDGDGHQDIAIAVHFGPQYVLYGNGKGDFSRSERLPSPDPRVTSRAIVADDFNLDGRQDLALAAEIDYDLASNEAIEGAVTTWVLLRSDDGWQVVTEGLPRKTIADVIRSTDFDRDGRPDLVISSNTVGERRLVYLNTEAGWRPAPFRGVLSSAYHYDAEPAPEGVFATFVQFRSTADGTKVRNGLVAYPFAFRAEGWRNGTPIVFDQDRVKVYFRLGVGDLNGDGRTDLVASRKTGGLEVYIQLDNGEFVLETSPELADVGTAYDIRLVDLDGDGRDDLVAGFAPAGNRKGGIGVWLSRSGS